jgi:beta-lactamase class A
MKFFTLLGTVLLDVIVTARGEETRRDVTPLVYLEKLHADSRESRARLEEWMVANQTGSKMIRANVPPDWRVGDKTGRSGKGATNDIAILRPPTGGPIFLTIYTIAPAESSEARDKLVAEAAKTALEALKR